MSTDNSICRLCLDETIHLIDAYNEIGNQLKIADVVAQHLQFDIKENDEISNKICVECWNKIADFHDFYTNIQKAQDTITIIESKFTLDDKTNLKEIFIEDALFKVNDQLQFDDVVTNDVFNDDECHDLDENDDQKCIKNLEIENNSIIDENVSSIVCSTDTNIQEIETINDDLSQVPDIVDTIPVKNKLQKTISNINLNNIDNVQQLENITNYKSNNREETLINITPESDRNLESTIISLKINERTSLLSIDEEYLNDGFIDECSDLEEDSNSKGKTEKSSEKSFENFLKVNRQKNNIVQKGDTKEDEIEMIESFYKMECEICHINVGNFDMLFDHYMKLHGIRGFITCCGKKYFKRSIIAEHVLWHREPDLFKCKICNKLYADSRCLNNHLLAHAPPGMKLFKCDHCPKSFVKKFKLNQHKLSHLTPEEKKYICDECDKPYASDALLRAHKRVVHEKTYAHMCDICARVFKSRVFFEKHQLEHLGKKLPKVQCQICKTWMKNEHTMRAHMRLHQDAGIIHKCDVCGKEGPSRNAILKHKRFVHLIERKFKCTLCDKAFKRAITLKEHMSVHTGEVLYTCTFCPKTFNSGANMHAHRKKAHPIEWETEKRNKIESMKPET